jgi:O-acetylserine/cysteine efflux transporter
MLLAGELVTRLQVVALLLATAGLGVILAHTDGSTTALGLGMTLTAAFSWAAGNLVSKRAGRVNMLAYVVWSCLFALPPLLALSLWVEGPAAVMQALGRADAATWAAVVWQAVGNTLFGYAAWAWLLSRHPAATIVPMALLVPVFGMGASAWWLGEALPAWKLGAAALVIGGLALNLLGPQILARLRR